MEKFQHFVSQMQLERFSDDRGRVHFWNKRAGKMLSQLPGKIFGQTHLYTTIDGSGEKNTWFEKQLAKLETAAAPLLTRIEEAAAAGLAPTLTADEKATLDRFFYTQWKRVPDFHDDAEWIRQGARKLDDIFAELRTKFPGRSAELDALDNPEDRRRLLQGGKIGGLAIESERVLSLFARRGLVILQLAGDGAGFVIGSLPIVRTGQSLEEPEGEAWLPIAPRLAIGPGMAEGTVTLATLGRSELLEFNRVVATRSTMFGGPDAAQIEVLGEWLKTRGAGGPD